MNRFLSRRSGGLPMPMHYGDVLVGAIARSDRNRPRHWRTVVSIWDHGRNV